jgi:hypothetical protein
MRSNFRNALPPMVLALTAALVEVAAAQPGPPPGPPPPMDTTPPPDTQPVEPPPVQPEKPAQPPPPQQPMVQPEATDDVRPTGTTVALGVGYGLPTSLETPNRTSLRLRLASGLTFEPTFAISNNTENRDSGATEETDKTTVFSIVALVRLPIVSKGKVDLDVLGTLGFTTRKENPEDDYNTVTTNSFGVGYGLGIGYWLSHHWQFSMSVTNPLVSYDQSKRQIGPGMTTKSSDTTLGLVFTPAVFMMIHLYN